MPKHLEPPRIELARYAAEAIGERVPLQYTRRWEGEEAPAVTSVRVYFVHRHALVHVWNRGAHAGALTVEGADWRDFVFALGFDADEPDAAP